jgi:hypothetical protein
MSEVQAQTVKEEVVDMAICGLCGKQLPSKGFTKNPSNNKPVHKICLARKAKYHKNK